MVAGMLSLSNRLESISIVSRRDGFSLDFSGFCDEDMATETTRAYNKNNTTKNEGTSNEKTILWNPFQAMSSFEENDFNPFIAIVDNQFFVASLIINYVLSS